VHLQPLVAPLGRELRASIDFFRASKGERRVAKFLVSGARPRSDFILQLLQTELAVVCKACSHPGIKLFPVPPTNDGVEQVAPPGTVAIGLAGNVSRLVQGAKVQTSYLQSLGAR